MHHLLIIDDVSDNVMFLKKILHNEPYTIQTANNSEEGFTKLYNNPFHLVIIDCMMPNMNGFDMCCGMKSDSKLSHIPVLLMTEFLDRKTIAKIFKAGADDYILKPFHKKEIITRIHSMLVKFYDNVSSIKNNDKEPNSMETYNDALFQISAANRAKGLFLSTIAEELRSPLNAIIGVINLFEETYVTDDQREFIDILKIAFESIMEIVNEIQACSEMEFDVIQLDRLPFPPKQIIRRATQIINITAMKKGLKVNYHIDESIPNLVIGDPYRFKQIITSLMNHLIKQTKNSHILLKCFADSCNNHRLDLHIQIEHLIDPSEYLPSITSITEFLKTKALSSLNTKGKTGLNFLIANQLCEAMGGSTTIDMNNDKQIVHLVIPFQLPDAVFIKSKELADKAKKIQSYNILLVEDNVMNQKIIKRFLEKKGLKVYIAETGQIALDLYKNIQFDLIITEIQLQEMDGIEMTEKIREYEKSSGKLTPIAVLSTHTTQEYRELCFKAGIDAYFNKPINKQILYEYLDQILFEDAN